MTMTTMVVLMTALADQRDGPARAPHPLGGGGRMAPSVGER
jgi:hypothetical protein